MIILSVKSVNLWMGTMMMIYVPPRSLFFVKEHQSNSITIVCYGIFANFNIVKYNKIPVPAIKLITPINPNK